MFRSNAKIVVSRLDDEFRLILRLDPKFEDWRSFAAGWLAEQKKGRTARRNSLGKFFINYLHGQKMDLCPKSLLSVDATVLPLAEVLDFDSIQPGFAQNTNDHISDFIEWVLREKLSVVSGTAAPHNLRNPFPRQASRIFGKSTDLEFNYLLQIDPRMEDWRDLGSEWLKIQRNAVNFRRTALDKFFNYLLSHDLERAPHNFLMRGYAVPAYVDSIVASKSLPKDARGKPKANSSDYSLNNYVHDFLNWILTEKLSVEGDNGHRVVPLGYHNPIDKQTSSGGSAPTESVRSPLAYSHIRELRSMLCQGQNICDWTWAHESMAKKGGGDWIKVDASLIDKTDPDCVWRQRRGARGETDIFEIWSPVRAIALYLKLELPLRTFQVRMLDSGEEDTWRYESGKWRLNDSPLAKGSERRPYRRGVFHRSHGEAGAGFYINTNKTADINKDERNKGYVIPWTHEPALYWLERLRNWQEKYNPIDSPTPWRALKAKHFGQTPPHLSVLDERGDCCFLFRDAASGDKYERDKPLEVHALNRLWYLLLLELEKRCENRGESLGDGKPIRFVEPGSYWTTFYPLHSLRVSMITAYALDGGVSFPVLSKLIAGHSRLVMTLYYTKAGKTHITEIMQEAEKNLLESEAVNYRRFLTEKTYQDIEQMFAFNSVDTLKSILQQKTAASFIFEDKGICPVAGGLCEVGGETLREDKSNPQGNIYAPVSGYPQERNCARCRFFITGPAFLPGLIAHFNWVSYRTTECSNRYVGLEQQVKALEDVRLDCEKRGVPFAQHQDLARLNSHYEAEAEKANKLLTDFQAIYRLIDRCMAISKTAEKAGLSLVTSGSIMDLRFALAETDSEMHQLEVICEDALVYPEIDAGKATLRRSQVLDTMLQINGRTPVFFRLDLDQQLHVGNEVMKLIRARAGSLKGAVEIAEGRRLLAECGLLDDTVRVIGNATGGLAFSQVIAFPQARLRRRAQADVEIYHES